MKKWGSIIVKGVFIGVVLGKMLEAFIKLMLILSKSIRGYEAFGGEALIPLLAALIFVVSKELKATKEWI